MINTNSSLAFRIALGNELEIRLDSIHPRNTINELDTSLSTGSFAEGDSIIVPWRDSSLLTEGGAFLDLEQFGQITIEGFPQLLTLSQVQNDQIKKHYRTHYLDQPAAGIRNRVTDKIRVIENNLVSGDTLSSLRSVQQRSAEDISYTPNVDYTEVAFSPQDQINDDIIAEYGHFNLGDYIGDPRELNARGKQYPELDKLRDAYFLKYKDSYDLVDFVRLIKFLDNSLFKMIKDFVPANTSLSAGVVVKQHLLERNRHKMVLTSYEDQTYSGSVQSSINEFRTGSISRDGGGVGGSFELVNNTNTSPEGINEFGESNRFHLTQSWSEITETLQGPVLRPRPKQQEFYDGIFGADIDPRTGEVKGGINANRGGSTIRTISSDKAGNGSGGTDCDQYSNPSYIEYRYNPQWFLRQSALACGINISVISITDITASPIVAPTPSPTNSPTPSPVTAAPTPSPTNAPTPAPVTNAPTPAPVTPAPLGLGATAAPTSSPTPNPTPSPTNAPTPSPTDAPTPAPTDAPTPAPVLPSTGITVIAYQNIETPPVVNTYNAYNGSAGPRTLLWANQRLDLSNISFSERMRITVTYRRTSDNALIGSDSQVYNGGGTNEFLRTTLTIGVGVVGAQGSQITATLTGVFIAGVRNGLPVTISNNTQVLNDTLPAIAPTPAPVTPAPTTPAPVTPAPVAPPTCRIHTLRNIGSTTAFFNYTRCDGGTGSTSIGGFGSAQTICAQVDTVTSTSPNKVITPGAICGSGFVSPTPAPVTPAPVTPAPVEPDPCSIYSLTNASTSSPILSARFRYNACGSGAYQFVNLTPGQSTRVCSTTHPIVLNPSVTRTTFVTPRPGFCNGPLPTPAPVTPVYTPPPTDAPITPVTAAPTFNFDFNFSIAPFTISPFPLGITFPPVNSVGGGLLLDPGGDLPTSGFIITPPPVSSTPAGGVVRFNSSTWETRNPYSGDDSPFFTIEIEADGPWSISNQRWSYSGWTITSPFQSSGTGDHSFIGMISTVPCFNSSNSRYSFTFTNQGISRTYTSPRITSRDDCD